jgi:hypothetical protein
VDSRFFDDYLEIVEGRSAVSNVSTAFTAQKWALHSSQKGLFLLSFLLAESKVAYQEISSKKGTNFIFSGFKTEHIAKPINFMQHLFVG